MAHPNSGSAGGPADASARLEEIVERFENAWQEGHCPDLKDYVPASSSLRLAVLKELAHVDLEFRLKAGDAVRVETYLSNFPELASDPQLVMTLIRAEFRLRQRCDPAVTPEEYARRFPGLSADLTGLLDTGPGKEADPAVTTILEGPANQPAGSEASLGGARYRPLRFHARGGLGEVFLARDDELNRDVAFKRIRPELGSDPDLRRRFVREAEVTGQLQHPGIVPVYGLSRDEAGQPCYAMRFIEGESLRDAIQAYHRRPTPLAFRQLLQRFITVCQTVAYAHNKGVIHRDLKPANIMLGRYGETLVVDWGLAKPTATGSVVPLPEAAADSTQVGQALGTPAYMAPEQAAGRWNEVGPASDIYSLGATLYELLAGRASVQGRTIPEVLDNVKRGVFLPPRQANGSVPRALEAVCLRAMALQPRDRYPSALALAEEVERFLADEPVTVYREPLPARAARWARRHPAQVAGGVVGLVVAAVALAGITLQSEYSRQALAQAQQQTDQQRQRADTNLSRAMKAIDRMLTKVSDERFAHLPQFEEERKKILEDALALNRELAEVNPTEPQARLAAGQAYARLGDISLLLDQVAAARQHYDKALALLGPLAQENPEGADYQQALANAVDQRGISCWKDPPEDDFKAKTLECFTQARAIWERLLQAEPGNVDYLVHFAATNYRVALALRANGRQAEAEPVYQKTMELQKQLVATDSSIVDYQATLGSVDFSAAANYLDQQKAREAADAYLQGIALFEKLIKTYPDHPKYLKELAYAYGNLGSSNAREGRLDEAQQDFARSAAYGERLIEDHPGVPEYRTYLPFALANLGRLYLQRQNSPQRAGYAGTLANLQQKLAEGKPGTDDYRSDLGDLFNLLAIVEAPLDPEAARASYDKARKGQERLASDHPEVSKYQTSLAGTYVNLGNLAGQQAKPAQGLVWYGRAIPLLEAVALADPKNPAARPFLRNAHMGRAGAFDKLSRHADAAKDWDRALELDAGPSRPYLRVQRALSLAYSDPVRAVADAEEMAHGEGVNGLLLYNLACVCAQAAAAIKDKNDLQERYAARAVELLEQARTKGFFADRNQVQHMKKDTDLDPLRSRADFQKLTAELEKAGGR
jgi:tetratricopeptide (TPR) repeat protein